MNPSYIKIHSCKDLHIYNFKGESSNLIVKD